MRKSFSKLDLLGNVGLSGGTGIAAVDPRGMAAVDSDVQMVAAEGQDGERKVEISNPIIVSSSVEDGDLRNSEAAQMESEAKDAVKDGKDADDANVSEKTSFYRSSLPSSDSTDANDCSGYL